MNMLEQLNPGSVPTGYAWINEPASWSTDAGNLTITPGPRTDFFRSPDLATTRDNAPMLAAPVTDDFTAIAHVAADLRSFGDAGTIVVRADEQTWAKICVERSPSGEIAIVSVVTRGVSDDSNSELLGSPAAWIRVSRSGPVLGMNYSTDGIHWRFVRVCRFEVPDEVLVGPSAQAPMAGGCSVTFDHFSITPGGIADLRSGE
jgi:regulation of enolase protein 1 (concanavalin A-like superfamily)